MRKKPRSPALLLLLLLAALSTQARAAEWVTLDGGLRAVLHKPDRKSVV